MKMSWPRPVNWAASLLICLLLSTSARAQPMAPQYEECRLDSIFPNGGARGTSVKVEFKGHGSGLSLPKDIVIDGPGGISVKELKSINGNTVEATLDIAADAPLGRRWLRVLSERSGLTNFAHFVVSSLPEHLEAEPNNDIAHAQRIESSTAVVNGRINPLADLDVFRVSAKAGQKFVAAIAAHALDVHGQGKSYGNADFSLELLDASGRTLAAAEDTIGFDPLIEQTIPADGDYFVRVQLLNYGGFPEAVYRLTLGAVPYVAGAFPPGLQRGTEASIELFGPSITAGKRAIGFSPLVTNAASVGQPTPDARLVQYVTLLDGNHSGLDVPLVLGSHSEIIEAEPNNDRSQAALLAWPVCVNGRFDQSGDADWYRVKLDAQQKVWLEIVAQRFIRSPVDTLIQVYDATGKLLGKNDDESFDPGYESYHDFKTTDSKLQFNAPAAGEFFVKVTEQSDISGPRAVYRLTVEEARPDFRVTHFPDAVPIWGPGSTSAMLVRIDRFVNFDDDVEVSVEGLPAGWASSSATSLGIKGIRPFTTYQPKVFVTLTAPADAQPGTCIPFRIVGRSRPENTTTAKIEREAIPLTLFYTSDTGYFRASPVARAAVAKPQGPWVDAVTPELTLNAGGSGTIQIKVHGAGDVQSMPIVVNLATNGVACALMTPQPLPIKDGLVEVPVKVPPETQPGTYYMTVAQTWRSDIRIGMPGPCTPLIKLIVTPVK